uniref:Response regulatory domain-containing protein n=1 Tax=Kalmanozyma brasiliensis (strain GHG001) TaxID=1365824 RepID=V5GVD4_KALBG
MSSESNANDPLAQASTSSSAPNGNATSSLEFTESDSNDPASALQRPRSPSKSAFQWPSEPLNNGRPSLPQDSQQSVDDANRDISQRITDAGHDATSGHSKPYPGLDRPRRPQVQNMDRTSSHGTNGSAASDGPDAPSSKPHYPNYLPDMLRNAATIPIDLLRSLVPDNAFPSNTDEGLSASTLQVPVTSFNALFEACKLFEWLANQASQLETLDRGHGSRRPSTTQQQSDDGVDFTYFDYLETLQKVADVVSGLAAARGIDLVLDLEPQLHGEPADNQRHYKLGSCTVWADRIALTFLFMSCISRLLRNSPVRSTVVVTTTLTPQEENVAGADDKMLSPETQIDSTGRKVVPFSFVIIDDDIVTLQKELLRIRSAVPILKSALASKASPHNPPANERRLPRPTLDHRTKSSPQVNRIMASQLGNASTRSFGSLGTELMNGENGNKNVDSMDESVSQTIIFFTSMKSYRLVRDTVQPIIDSASFRGVASPPEIMVLPKPAGPRRILTALHVAQHKPLVRLPFLPIATSPLSPLITHSKTWWSSDSSQQQDGQGFMTLTRRETDSTFAEEDTTPSTPWSPIEAAHAPEGISTPEIPLTKENLPLAAAPAAKGASIRTVTQPTGADDAASSAAMTTKSAPRSSISRQTGNNTNADATPAPAPIPADASVAPKTNSGGSGAPSTTSPLSSSQLARSQAVSSPMPADALEYFSETAAKMGGSAASGMVIQSPDGRPAGIFFQPKSTPSVPGSKPGLSRGMSASSIRRGPSSETSERSDTAARDRRLMNRSVGSTGAGRRGSAADIHNLRPSDLPTLNEQGTPAGSAASTDSRPSQLSNVGKYPSGSMFAPQVGIHSVLNSSRPPMTTPLSSLASQAREADEDSAGAQDAAATQDVTQKSDSGKPADSSPQATDAGKPTGETSQPSKPTGPGSTKSAGSAAVGEGAAPGTNPAPAIASGSNSTTATPNARTAPNAAHRLANKAAPASATASPSDPRKPSAVPQSGFMMGMGFTSTKRRNQGPKKAPVREAVLPPIKVLIVEDNPINQRILSMFMGKKKIKYDVANNGREAVEKWKTGGYHLILMDIQLPVMDGIEATKEIRKLERSANIGILPNTPEAVAEGGGSRTVTAKGVKGQVASPSTKPASGSGGPGAKGALVNGVGEANRTRPASSGSINPFRASVIIVALTASVLSSDRVEALAAGCNDFLNKPVSLPWLNQKILEWGSMMYLMYSGLSSDDIHLGDTHATANSGAAGGRVDRAQLHLGFGYGPAEKAKALANNLHLGDTLAAKKKKRAEANQAQSEANKEQREANMEQREANVEKKEGQQEQQKQAKEQPSTASEEAPAEKSAEEVVGKDKDEDKDGNEKDKHEEKDEAAG